MALRKQLDLSDLQGETERKSHSHCLVRVIWKAARVDGIQGCDIELLTCSCSPSISPSLADVYPGYPYVV